MVSPSKASKGDKVNKGLNIKYLVEDVFTNSFTIHFVFTNKTGCRCKRSWEEDEKTSNLEI